MSPVSQESVSQSFTDVVSVPWASAKSFPVICLPQHGTDPSHLELRHDACHLASLQGVDRSASAAHIFRRTGFQAFRAGVLNPLVKGDSNHVLVGVCQNVALEQDEVTDGPWHETWFPLGVHPS